MKKIMILSSIAAILSMPMYSMASIDDGLEKYSESKSIKLSKTYKLIVQFKDKNMHKAFLSDPKTAKLLEDKAENEGVSLDSLKSKYNVKSNVNYEYGTSNLNKISQRNGYEFSHIRSMSMNADVVEISAENNLNIQNIIVELLNSGDFESVMVDNVLSKMDFNDPKYNDQDYFKNPSPFHLKGQGFEEMRNKTVNNLGRNVRVGVVDSGYANHEDIKGFVEGYNFVRHYDDSYAGEVVRSSDPTDKTLLKDGSICHDGHGLSVASLIGATSNNGLGMVGAVDSEQLDLVYARALNCLGDGSTSDILDSVVWMMKEPVPNVPLISSPVDVINLSLGGYTLSGCSGFEQLIYTDAREKNITVVVAAGNSNDNVKSYSPASCNDVITVGAVDSSGDKASFSNYGKNVDVTASGTSMWMLSTDEFNPTKELYFQGSGTSMATPLIASAAANLLMANPSLTPDQIESILSANTTKFKSNLLCSQLGCGSGIVNASSVMDAIPEMLSSVKYERKHSYEGYNSDAQKVWLNKMNKYHDVCQSIKYTWGNIGIPMNGVEYKLYNIENQESNYIETTSIPEKTFSVGNENIGVQICKDGSCGSIFQMKGQVTPPSFCL